VESPGMPHKGGWSVAKSVYELRVVLKDGLRFGTVFWAKWDKGHIYYGVHHRAYGKGYLRSSYHIDGKQHTYTPEGRDIHIPISETTTFTGCALRWTHVITPDLNEIIWTRRQPKPTSKRRILQAEVSELPGWPLRAVKFWLVEHGRQDLVQEILKRNILKGRYVLVAETQPQMLAFFSPPTEEELRGIAFVMREGPPRDGPILKKK